ncbi:SnoaL-like domain protein [Stieleria bergensis]|uniref:SnoaL-like domain protein n=1 Tax=Stieleria bergensis TaxID=2528025 RepID=A0A517SNZ6_9BACT|nr:SnoaL-like domain protein [Planctomycetes bacterium SV_7m_r]
MLTKLGMKRLVRLHMLPPIVCAATLGTILFGAADGQTGHLVDAQEAINQIGQEPVVVEIEQPGDDAVLDLKEEQGSQEDSDRVALQEAIEQYVAAFNERDVERFVALWTEEALYRSDDRDSPVAGREALTELVKNLFDHSGDLKLLVDTQSLEFVSPQVAIETGQASVQVDGKVTESDYRTVYVKQAGKWLIDSVNEQVRFKAPSRDWELHGLGFLVGRWVYQADDLAIDLRCHRSVNSNFLVRKYIVQGRDELESVGIQLIGWDPADKRIKSWLFDSHGSVVEGNWEQVGDHWTVHSNATLGDSEQGTFSVAITPVDANTYRWRKFNRSIGATLLPNVSEIQFERLPE